MKGFVVLVLLAFVPVSAQQNTPPTAPTPESRLFVVHFLTGPAWQTDLPFNQQKFANEHSQNLARLRREGVLLLGARYGEKGMIVLRTVSEQEARAQVEKDPTVQAKIFVYEIAAFQPFYEGCVVRVAAKREACVS